MIRRHVESTLSPPEAHLSPSWALARFLSRYFTIHVSSPSANQRSDTPFSPPGLSFDGIEYQIMRYRLGGTCLRIGFFLIQIRVCYLTVRQGYIFVGMIPHPTMPYAVAGDDYLFHVDLEVFDWDRISVCPITL